MARGYSASEAREMARDVDFEISDDERIRLSKLASPIQVVTNSAWPVRKKGQNGELVPPQLSRPLVIEDYQNDRRISLRPYIPEKLEPWLKEIIGERRFNLDEEEASRKQVSFHLILMMLTKALAGGLTEDDRFWLGSATEKLQSGSHDEESAGRLVAMVPEVNAALLGNDIKALASLYERHFTDPRIFAVLRTFSVGVEVVLNDPKSENFVKVNGLVGVGDFVDELMKDQKTWALVNQKATDVDEPRMPLAADFSDEAKGGVIAEEGELILRVLRKKLGVRGRDGEWITLDQLMKNKAFKKYHRYELDQTNLPDLEVMMPLSQESMGTYGKTQEESQDPYKNMISAQLYPLYMCGRDFCRAMLMDLMVQPDFGDRAGKQVRKMRRWVYDSWTYRHGKPGMAEVQKAYPYKDPISEKFIPAMISMINFEVGSKDWRNQLRQRVEAGGGVWLTGLDRAVSLGAAQRMIIEKIFTKPTILPSETFRIEGLITALIAVRDGRSLEGQLAVYGDELNKMVKKQAIGLEEEERRKDEMGKLLAYWSDGGVFKSEWEISSNPSLKDWLKHEIVNELYRARGQRPGTLKTNEEIRAAFESLTVAEEEVLKTGGMDLGKLLKNMGIKGVDTRGFEGLRQLVQKFSWNLFPVGGGDKGILRTIDFASLGGYIVEQTGLTSDTSKFIEGVGANDFKENVKLSNWSQTLDSALVLGVSAKLAELLSTTFRYVSNPDQRERARETVKLMVRGMSPLKSEVLIPAIEKTVFKPGQSPNWQELFMSINMLVEKSDVEFLWWLKGQGIRGHEKNGEEGTIFLGDYPVRAQVPFGRIEMFRDMRLAAKRCRQPVSQIGLEREDHNTVGWQLFVDQVATLLKAKNLMDEDAKQEIYRYCKGIVPFTHRYSSEKTSERVINTGADVLGFLSEVLNLFSSK
jgi:hypothetical protein